MKTNKLNEYIATIPDYPEKGILFRDITPLMQNGDAFKYSVDKMTEFVKKLNATLIVGPEARGFIFGCPVATNLKIGFSPVRKPGKLPRDTVEVSYKLEYGSNTLCLHKDSVKPGDKVVIVDDLLATGGTVEAAIKLVKKLGGTVVGAAFLIELDDLKGRNRIDKNIPIFTLLHY